MKPRRANEHANSFGIIFGPSGKGKFVEGKYFEDYLRKNRVIGGYMDSQISNQV